MSKNGNIFLVATPIGNMDDITFRALRILKEVHVVYAEDTRNTKKLFSHFQIHNKLESFHSHNQKIKTTAGIKNLKSGKDIAVVSDAGTPGISDPAYFLIKEAIKENITIVPIPGATALISALISSGLPTDRFYFQGFLPLKKGKQKTLKFLAELPNTIVIYESVHRLQKNLNKILEIFGNRHICIARELTKVFESFYRGPIEVLLNDFDQITLKGEFVLIIAGKNFKSKENEDYDEN